MLYFIEGRAGNEPASTIFVPKHLIWRSTVNTKLGAIASFSVARSAASTNWATPPCLNFQEVAEVGFEPTLKQTIHQLQP